MNPQAWKTAPSPPFLHVDGACGIKFFLQIWTICSFSTVIRSPLFYLFIISLTHPASRLPPLQSQSLAVTSLHAKTNLFSLLSASGCFLISEDDQSLKTKDYFQHPSWVYIHGISSLMWLYKGEILTAKDFCEGMVWVCPWCIFFNFFSCNWAADIRLDLSMNVDAVPWVLWGEF